MRPGVREVSLMSEAWHSFLISISLGPFQCASPSCPSICYLAARSCSWTGHILCVSLDNKLRSPSIPSGDEANPCGFAIGIHNSSTFPPHNALRRILYATYTVHSHALTKTQLNMYLSTILHPRQEVTTNEIPAGFVEQNGRLIPYWYSRVSSSTQTQRRPHLSAHDDHQVADYGTPY